MAKVSRKNIILSYKLMKAIIEKELTGEKKEEAIKINELYKDFVLGNLNHKSKEYLEFLQNEYLPLKLKLLNQGINLDKKN